MPELFVKALIGAGLVITIDFVSKSDNFYLAGLIPLIPSFSLIAHIIVGTTRTESDLRTTILFGALSLLPFLGYLLILYFLCNRLKLFSAITIALFGWLTLAGLLIVFWKGYVSTGITEI